MGKELTSDEENLRSKARRRLTGAVALTLAVVVILPMVLDIEPKPAMQDIELRIPSPDKAGEFVPDTMANNVKGVAHMASSAPTAVSAPAAALSVAKAMTANTNTVAAPVQSASGKIKTAEKSFFNPVTIECVPDDADTGQEYRSRQ